MHKCIYIYRLYEGNDYDKKFEVFSTLKKLNKNNILIEKYRDMLENPDFEQDYWSRTAIGIYKIRHDSIILMKWLIYHDRCYYDNMNYFDLMGSILFCLKKL